MKLINILIIIFLVLLKTSCKEDDPEPDICSPIFTWSISVENQTNTKQVISVIGGSCRNDQTHPSIDRVPKAWGVEIESDSVYNESFINVGYNAELLIHSQPFVGSQFPIAKSAFSLKNSTNVVFIIEADSMGNFSGLKQQ